MKKHEPLIKVFATFAMSILLQFQREEKSHAKVLNFGKKINQLWIGRDKQPKVMCDAMTTHLCKK